MSVVEKTVLIKNKKGLHARASAKMVRIAGGFEADIQVRKDNMSVVATSIMGLLLLAASQGDKLDIIACGVDAADAAAAVVDLVDQFFHEPE